LRQIDPQLLASPPRKAEQPPFQSQESFTSGDILVENTLQARQEGF